MKILFVNDFGYRLGGAENVFFAIYKGLKKKGQEVFTLSSNCVVDNHKVITDFQILESGHLFNLDSYFNIINYFQFKKILRKIQPDIVHLNNIFYTISPSILYALKNYKTVMTLHDYYIICIKDKRLPNKDICTYNFGNACNKKGCVNKRRYFGERIRRNIIKQGLKNVNLFISPTEYLKKEFEKNGINNISVLPNPMDYDLPPKQEFANSNILLYIGRLADQKGVDYLIKAMPGVVSRHPEALLKIAGDGPQEHELRRLVDELKLNNNVKFLGWTDNSAKKRLINESLILIIPSVWPENGPLVKYEAACYGKASIASAVGAIPEFIQEGKTGFLVPPRDAKSLAQKIIYVLENKHILNKISENLIKKIEDYRLEKYIDRLSAIYERILYG